jgi:hypothetical protein
VTTFLFLLFAERFPVRDSAGYETDAEKDAREYCEGDQR